MKKNFEDPMKLPPLEIFLDPPLLPTLQKKSNFRTQNTKLHFATLHTQTNTKIHTHISLNQKLNEHTIF